MTCRELRARGSRVRVYTAARATSGIFIARLRNLPRSRKCMNRGERKVPRFELGLVSAVIIALRVVFHRRLAAVNGFN